MALYRKYLEPEYGEVAPYVNNEPPIPPKAATLKAWRVQSNYETLTDLTNMMRNLYCYQDLMNVEIDDYRVPNMDNENILLRVYHPDGEGPFPVMLFIHGGGWCMNNLDLYDYVPRYFAKFGGIAVVAVDYRLCPEYKFPKGLEDCYVALEWTAANMDKFNGSPESLTVCGDSAGGNLAAAISIMARDKKGPKIHKQILIFPATTFNADKVMDSTKRYGGGHYFLNIAKDAISNGEDGSYLPNPAVDRLNPYASPLELTDFTDIPPACFIQSECDPILDHGLMYAAKLEDNGVPVEMHIYKGMLHAFLNRPYKETFDAWNDIIAACPKLKK